MAEPGYTITRTFDAPPKVVWEAWTNAEHFAVWFGTEATEMRDVELDARPGGHWKGTMVLADGTRVQWRGVYREVERPRRLVLDLADSSTLGEEYERFTVTFAGHGDKTEMVLRQTGGHLTDEQYERTRVGTDSFMDSLAGLLPGMLKARHDAI